MYLNFVIQDIHYQEMNEVKLLIKLYFFTETTLEEVSWAKLFFKYLYF